MKMEKIVVCLLLVTLCGELSFANSKDNVLRFKRKIAREVHSQNENDKRHYADCHELRHEGGYNVSGTYTLHLNQSYKYQIRCEFTANNSYIIIQSRTDASLSFIKPFAEYLYPFGYPGLNYWAGLYNIYQLTTVQGNTVLTINLQNWTGQSYVLRYHHFSLMDNRKFGLTVQGYQGALPDDLSFNNGMPFATYDRLDLHNCAFNQHAGWWYNNCSNTLLNGVYYPGGQYQPRQFYNGIYYKDWMGYGYSLKFVSMSISRY